MTRKRSNAQILITGTTYCHSFEIKNALEMCVVELERQMYFKYSSFMSVLKESEGFCSAQGKGIR